MNSLLVAHRAGDYHNFVEEPVDASRFFDAETWKRLRTVKALYDPRTSSRAITTYPRRIDADRCGALGPTDYGDPEPFSMAAAREVSAA